MAENTTNYKETVVHINRVAKVVKGGRRFSFNCIAAVGDGNGKVGIGMGKANEVTDAIRKSIEAAKRDMIEIPIAGDGTIPHEILGKTAGAKIFLKPAKSGTGIIACSAVRAVLEAAGIKNVFSKSLGSNNAINIVKATMECLKNLRSAEEIAELRGKDVKSMLKWK